MLESHTATESSPSRRQRSHRRGSLGLACAGTWTSVDPLAADLLDSVGGISAQCEAKPRSPVSLSTRLRCALGPTRGSRAPSAESALEAETESVGDPAAISTARTNSIPVYATAPESQDGPRPTHLASQRILTGPSAQCALPNQYGE